MKCDICKVREAIMFIQQVSNQATTELHLCGECARERGIGPQGQRLEGALNKFLAGFSDKRACSICGQKLEDIKKYKSLGCPHCYTEFSQEIIEYLQRKNAEPYTGSFPSRLEGFRSLIEERTTMQKKLENAVQNEDYEKAAVYRDALKKMELTDAECN